ncbi:hypothetical protein AB5I41_29680 [Sphingomonas sp. MMS24-JH45]
MRNWSNFIRVERRPVQHAALHPPASPSPRSLRRRRPPRRCALLLINDALKSTRPTAKIGAAAISTFGDAASSGSWRTTPRARPRRPRSAPPGDLTDRGPDSAGVVASAMLLAGGPFEARFVAGNHEEMLLAAHAPAMPGCCAPSVATAGARRC